VEECLAATRNPETAWPWIMRGCPITDVDFTTQ
jgi:hypothetical protein